MLPLNERAFLYNYLARTLSKKVAQTEALRAYEEDIELPKRYHRRLNQAIFLLGKENLPTALKKARLIPEEEGSLLEYAYTQKETLPAMLLVLSKQLHTRALLQRRMKTLLVYPIILIAELLLVLSLAVFWLAPQLAFFFSSLHLPVPPLLHIFTAIQQVLAHLFSLAQLPRIIIIACIVWLLYQIATIPSILEHFHHILLRFSKIGHLYRLTLAQKLVSSLAVLIASTKTISAKELTIIAKSMNNLAYKKTLYNLATHIEKGGTYTQFFKNRARKKFFPSIVFRMFILGEKHNNLPQEIKALSKILTEEVEIEIKHFISILEPIIIVGIAGIVLLLALMLKSILGQMYSFQLR